MLPVAHAGHWALWVLYAVPVFIVLGSIVVQMRRDRREGDELDAGDAGRDEHERKAG